MKKLKDVTVVKKANIYYDGRVTSRTVELKDGNVISLGIMLEGEYTFGTNEAEIMEILSGDLDVKLPNEDWKTIVAPDMFNVPANSSFDLKIHSITDYCCSYIKS